MKIKVLILSFLITLSFQCSKKEVSNENTDTIDSTSLVSENENKTNSENIKLNLDSIYNSLGGDKKLIVKEDPSRCNYFKSNFILNKTITDSTILKNLANYISVKVRNTHETKQHNCTSPVCSNVHIYMNNEDYSNKNKGENGVNDVVYSECLPIYPDGDPYINKTVFEKYMNVNSSK